VYAFLGMPPRTRVRFAYRGYAAWLSRTNIKMGSSFRWDDGVKVAAVFGPGVNCPP